MKHAPGNKLPGKNSENPQKGRKIKCGAIEPRRAQRIPGKSPKKERPNA